MGIPTGVFFDSATQAEAEAGVRDDVGMTPLGTKQAIAVQAGGVSLPSQTGNSGKVLGTDGTNTSWVTQSGGSLPTQTGQNGKFLTTDGSAASWGTPSGGGSGITLGTLLATTSGTSKDYTSLPAGLKRITVMLNGVSSNGGSALLLRVGDSTGFYISGYAGAAGYFQNTNLTGVYANSTGFNLVSASAGNALSGNITLTLMDSSTNVWSCSYTLGATAGAVPFGVAGSGTVDLANVLDRIRLTSTNGTDTFDAGSINISYE